VTTLELWFDYGSTYSYVAAMRAEEVAARAGVALAWRPFLLGPIFEARYGFKDSPFNRDDARGRHMWRDVERLCAKHGIAFARPSIFPRSGLLAARVAWAADGAPWLPAFHRAVFAENFARDRDIGAPEVVASVLRALGEDDAAWLTRAAAPEAKARLRAATSLAAERGFFGAPTLLAGDELFFGQDRLEDAAAWCAAGR
jgi:2-hydroxychromene-2-carboxylate isomerase